MDYDSVRHGGGSHNSPHHYQASKLENAGQCLSAFNTRLSTFTAFNDLFYWLEANIDERQLAAGDRP
jgi:hypothetical protein